jgi:hypothetical protein
MALLGTAMAGFAARFATLSVQVRVTPAAFVCRLGFSSYRGCLRSSTGAMLLLV